MTARSLGKALRPLSAAFRAKVRALYLAERPPKFDRARLEQCLFEVQESIEWSDAYQAGGESYQRRNPLVETINAIRNVLLDDLGMNEGEQMNRLRDSRPSLRWPHVERIASIIAEKRRTAPAHIFGKPLPTASEAA